MTSISALLVNCPAKSPRPRQSPFRIIPSLHSGCFHVLHRALACTDKPIQRFQPASFAKPVTQGRPIADWHGGAARSLSGTTTWFPSPVKLPWSTVSIAGRRPLLTAVMVGSSQCPPDIPSQTNLNLSVGTFATRISYPRPQTCSVPCSQLSGSLSLFAPSK